MENIQDNSRVPLESQQSLKPPLQPLDIKKRGFPLSVLLIIAVLGFVLASVVFALFSKSAMKSVLAKKQKKHEAVKKQPAPLMEVLPLPSAPEPVASEPTLPKPLPTLTLSGILFDEKGSLALINGRLVPEGGMIEGAKLQKVTSDSVELSFEGKKIILRSR